MHEFILEQCPSLINLPKNFLYTSPLINLYRKRLFNLVNGGYKINKNKMHNFQNNLTKLQIDDDINNTHLFTNRTVNNNIKEVKYYIQ